MQNLRFGYVLGTAAALFVPTAILLAKAVAPLFAVTAVAVLSLYAIRHRSVPLYRGAVSIVLAVIGSWVLASWFWSITPDETIKTGISFAVTLLGAAVLFFVGGCLDGRDREIFRFGLIVGGAIGFALIAFEFATNAWLARNLYGLAGKLLFSVYGSFTGAMNPGLAATVIFFWPWAAALAERFPARISVPGIAAAVTIFLLSDADAVILGLGAGAAFFAVAIALPRVVPWALGGVIAVGILAAPMIPRLLPNPIETGKRIEWISNSAAHRIVIWNTTASHITRHPVVGGGFDTSRALYGPKDKVNFVYPKIKGKDVASARFEPIPLHPHNAVLQVWLELGGVGAVLFLTLMVAMIRAIHLSVARPLLRAMAMGQMASGLVIASISFGAWQSWWLTSILLAGAFMVSVVGPLRGNRRVEIEPPQPREARELGGPKGSEPTRYGDWERKGRAIDF